MTTTPSTDNAAVCGQSTPSADKLRTENPCVPPGEYGEPWTYGVGAESDEEGWWHRYAIIWNRYDHTMCKERHLDNNLVDGWHRIVACVNACAGMADPAVELAAMREAIKEARDAILRLLDNGHDDRCAWINYAGASCTCGLDAGHSALAKLQPFTTPGA